jgi:hypothetical protein
MLKAVQLCDQAPTVADLPAWTTAVAYGVRIAMGADSEEGLRRLRTILPPGARLSNRVAIDVSYAIRPAPLPRQDTQRKEFAGYLDGEVLVRLEHYDSVLEAMERHLHLHVAEHAPRRVFVHAGVIGWNNRAVVIPGRTLSGKSTLVAAFLRAGATYYSDEFAVVDSLGRIHPYPQAISLRDRNYVSTKIEPADFPAPTGSRALRAALILVTHHRDGQQRWRLREASPGEGMLALLANTVSARREPRRALRTLRNLLDGARVLKGARGEADAVVARLIRQGYLAA